MFSDWKNILVVVCVLFGGTMLNALQAKPTTKDTLSIEEQQQFLYYFYAAERLIQTEQIEKAKP